MLSLTEGRSPSAHQAAEPKSVALANGQLPPADYCLLLKDSAGEYLREAQHGKKIKNRLHLLKGIARNDDLVARYQVNRIRRAAFINRRNIHADRREISAGLFPQHVNFAAVTGLQHTTCFGYCFGNRQAARHWPDSRRSYVTDDAVAIRTGFVQRNRDLRVNNVFVVAFLD